MRARLLPGRARCAEDTLSSLTRFGGLDGATATRDVAVRPTAETWQVAHATAGLSALVAQRETLAPALVMREATGGVAGPLRAALAVPRGPVGRAHPRQVRAVAQAVGSLATTARLDARVLAHCAAAGRPLPRPLPEAAPPALRARRLRRRHGVDRLTAERQRLGTVPPRMPQAMAQPMAGWAGQRRRLDDALPQALQRRAVEQATAALRPSLPGVGPVLARPRLGPGPACGP